MKLSSRSPLGRVLIGLACIVGGLFILAVGVFGGGYLRNFYVPAEAMAPTLEKNDRFVARMDRAGTPRRGDIILHAMDRSHYIKRIAGLPGDIVGMADGVVILNGLPVAQRFLREEQRADDYAPQSVRRLAERFPGEATEHEILDMGPSPVDDMPEVRIPPGHLYVLGDHRDRSADSRVPREQMGSGLVPFGDVRGHPLYQTWPWAKAGRKLSR